MLLQALDPESSVSANSTTWAKTEISARLIVRRDCKIRTKGLNYKEDCSPYGSFSLTSPILSVIRRQHIGLIPCIAQFHHDRWPRLLLCKIMTIGSHTSKANGRPNVLVLFCRSRACRKPVRHHTRTFVRLARIHFASFITQRERLHSPVSSYSVRRTRIGSTILCPAQWIYDVL